MSTIFFRASSHFALGPVRVMRSEGSFGLGMSIRTPVSSLILFTVAPALPITVPWNGL